MLLLLSVLSYVVLRVQFASNTFSGLESSSEILITIIIVGGTPEKKNVTASIHFLELTAHG